MENPMQDEILLKANHDLNEVAKNIATLHAEREALKKVVHEKDVVIANQYEEIARLHQALKEQGNP